MTSSTIRRMVKVISPQGFHLRPADQFVRLASQFESTVNLTKLNEAVDGKSILAILTLAAAEGTELEVSASGSDAEEAVSVLSEFIESGFASESAQTPREE